MATTAEEIPFNAIPTTSTASAARTTTLTAATLDPIPSTSTGTLRGTHQGGQSTGATAGAATAQQIEDLNFYLRRISIGGNSDISQIESFGGGPDYEMFLDAVSSAGLHYGWTEAQILRTVEIKLKDKAREYYGALLPVERPRNMVEMKLWFSRVFGRKLSMSAGKRELERCIRIPGEPLGEYAQRLKVVANKMFPASALVTHEKLYHRNLLLANQFVEGLDRRLANEIRRAGEFYNLDDCLDVAEGCEEIVSRMIPETGYDIIRSLEVDAEEDPTAEGEGVRPGNRGYEVYDRTRAGIESRTGHPRGRAHHQPPGRYTQRQEMQHGRRYSGENEEYAQTGAGPSHGAGPLRGGRHQPWSRGFRMDRTEGQQEPAHGRMRRQGVNVSGRNDATPISFTQRFPYMHKRCLRCGQEGHRAKGCLQLRREFCYHCGEEGPQCHLNFQRPQLQNPM